MTVAAPIPPNLPSLRPGAASGQPSGASRAPDAFSEPPGLPLADQVPAAGPGTGRSLAADWVDGLGVVDGASVLVNASALVHSTASFAAQLVRSALVDHAAGELVVVSGPAEFVNDVKLAAEDLGVAGRVRFAVDDPLLHA